MLTKRYDIFLSYIREDSDGWCAMLYRSLADNLPTYSVFKDDEDTTIGMKWAPLLRRLVKKCRFFILVVSKDWSNPAVQKRMADPDDWVRREILTATKSKCLIIPVLVDGAPRPTGLPTDIQSVLDYNQCFRFSSGSEKWDEEITKLCAEITGEVKRRSEGDTNSRRVDGGAIIRFFYLNVRVLGHAAVGLSAVAISIFVTQETYSKLNAGVIEQTASAPCLPRPFLAPEMIVLSGGAFDMGSPMTEAERSGDERLHSVTIEPFAIGRCEVTFAEYDAFAAATKREQPDDEGWGRGRRPVINVSWDDATTYARWLSEQTGERYRLPTEAQWAYAARAGSSTPFSFGDSISPTQANYNGTFSYNGGATGEYRSQTLPVGQFSSNAFGLYDVHGNVWEWTCSIYDADYNGEEARCVDTDEDGTRVLRGGSWGDYPRRLRSANRYFIGRSNRYSDIGFRLSRALP